MPSPLHPRFQKSTNKVQQPTAPASQQADIWSSPKVLRGERFYTDAQPKVQPSRRRSRNSEHTLHAGGRPNPKQSTTTLSSYSGSKAFQPINRQKSVQRIYQASPPRQRNTPPVRRRSKDIPSDSGTRPSTPRKTQIVRRKSISLAVIREQSYRHSNPTTAPQRSIQPREKLPSIPKPAQHGMNSSRIQEPPLMRANGGKRMDQTPVTVPDAPVYRTQFPDGPSVRPGPQHQSAPRVAQITSAAMPTASRPYRREAQAIGSAAIPPAAICSRREAGPSAVAPAVSNHTVDRFPRQPAQPGYFEYKPLPSTSSNHARASYPSPARSRPALPNPFGSSGSSASFSVYLQTPVGHTPEEDTIQFSFVTPPLVARELSSSGSGARSQASQESSGPHTPDGNDNRLWIELSNLLGRQIVPSTPSKHGLYPRSRTPGTSSTHTAHSTTVNSEEPLFLHDDVKAVLHGLRSAFNGCDPACYSELGGTEDSSDDECYHIPSRQPTMKRNSLPIIEPLQPKRSSTRRHSLAPHPHHLLTPPTFVRSIVKVEAPVIRTSRIPMFPGCRVPT